MRTSGASSEQVLLAIISVTQKALDRLLSDSQGADGKLKAPSVQVVMQARAVLPSQFSQALKKRPTSSLESS